MISLVVTTASRTTDTPTQTSQFFKAVEPLFLQHKELLGWVGIFKWSGNSRRHIEILILSIAPLDQLFPDDSLSVVTQVTESTLVEVWLDLLTRLAE